MATPRINKDLYVGDTGKQLKQIKTNADNIATNTTNIATNTTNINNLTNNLNVNYEVLHTTATAAPVQNDTSWKTILTKTLNKGLYLVLANLQTNNWGSGGRDFPTDILLNDVIIASANQVLVSGAYLNTRTMNVILNVTQDNSTMKIRVRSSTTSPYALSASDVYLIKLNKV